MTARTLTLALGSLALFVGCGNAKSPTSASAPTRSPHAAGNAGSPSPCSARQLSWKTWTHHPGDTADLGALVMVTNTSDRACSLSGRPPATATVSTGDSIPAISDPIGSSLPADAGRPLTLMPGDLGYLRFRDPSECSTGVNQSPPSYTTVDLQLNGQTVTIPLRGVTAPASCRFPLYESPFYK